MEILAALLTLIFAVWPALEPHQEAVLARKVPFRFDQHSLYEADLLLITSATVIDLSQHTVVFTNWDMMWPYYYAAQVQHKHADLAFIETHPADDHEQVAASLVHYVASQVGKRPLFFAE